jgi:hypothetical protein
VHAAVVKAIVRLDVAEDENSPQKFCSATTVHYHDALIAKVNNIITNNGGALPLVTTCLGAEADSMEVSSVVGWTRYLSSSQLRALTHLWLSRAAVQMSANTVVVRAYHHSNITVVRHERRWLVDSDGVF